MKINRNHALRALLAGVLILSCSLAGCGQPSEAESELPISGFIPAFLVTGDVAEPKRVDGASAGEYTWTTVVDEEIEYPCVMLGEVVASAVPNAEAYDLLLVGSDGLTSKISGAGVEDCHIAFSDEYAWNLINLEHPVSSRIKMLAEIVVVAAEGSDGVGFVGADGSRFVTPGQMQLGELTRLREFEGQSEINGKDVTVYTQHFLTPLTSLVLPESAVAVVGKNGELAYDRGFAEASVEVSGNRLDYRFSGGEVLGDLAGVLADPPNLNITEARSDALHMLERGDRVLLLELDGWGWHMAEEAARLGVSPALSSYSRMQAMAAYPPISPVGLASILTGLTPDGHGVHSRDDRALAAEDLFAAAGVDAAYIEGDTVLIETSLAPVLSPDLGGKPGTDDEVFANTEKAIDSGAALVFAHFHGIDDIATDTGPLSGEAMAKLAEIDGYVAELLASWDGMAVITADHGLHALPEGGSHGQFMAEDMLVPYIITEGGGYIAKDE